MMKDLDYFVTDKRDMKDVSAANGQIITIPSQAKTEYAGPFLLKFNYSFESYGSYVGMKTYHRTFKGEIVRDKSGTYMEYTHKDDLRTIKYATSRFFENEASAYEYMWKYTGMTYETINTEMIAYITESGVYVSANAFNSAGSAFNTYNLTKKNGSYYIYGKKVLAEIHTHPNINPAMNGANAGLSGADFKAAAHEGHLGLPVISMAWNGLVEGVVYKQNGNTFKMNIINLENVNTLDLISGKTSLINKLKKN